MKPFEFRSSSQRIRRVDLQVSIFTAVIVLLVSVTMFFLYYRMTYRDMIESLIERVYSIYDYLEEHLDKQTFLELGSKEDFYTPQYQEMKTLLENAKNTAGVRYLYTAKQTAQGDYIYLVDGLDEDASDFRYPGDLIEPEIHSDMLRALSGQVVLPRDIKDTDWGKIFITYFPIHHGSDVIGVLGIEFEAEHQYNTYRMLRLLTPAVVLAACALSVVLAVRFFRRISNPSYQDLSNTDQLTQLKSRNAFDIDLKNLDSSSHQAQAGLAVIDLNRLKQVNDTYGHEAGDQYIQALANALRQAGGKNFLLYRVGGDEFVAMSSRTSEDELGELIDQTRELLRLHEFPWPLHVSFSAGFACFDPNQDRELFDSYRRADISMYENKRKMHESGF